MSAANLDQVSAAVRLEALAVRWRAEDARQEVPDRDGRRSGDHSRDRLVGDCRTLDPPGVPAPLEARFRAAIGLEALPSLEALEDLGQAILGVLGVLDRDAGPKAVEAILDQACQVDQGNRHLAMEAHCNTRFLL